MRRKLGIAALTLTAAIAGVGLFFGLDVAIAGMGQVIGCEEWRQDEQKVWYCGEPTQAPPGDEE